MLRRSRFVADSKWLAPVLFVSLVISACGSDDKLAVVPQNPDAPTQLAPAKAAPIDAAITDTTQGQQSVGGTALPEPVPTKSEPTELVTEENTTHEVTSNIETVTGKTGSSSSQPSVPSEANSNESSNSTIGGNGTVASSENPQTQDSIIELDTDGDGINNVDDPEDDNDGFNDEYDKFPLDASEFLDWDADGIGDFADQDDDNDGVPDIADFLPLNPDCSSELEIFQGECIYGFSDKAEILEFDDNGYVYLINRELKLVFKYNLEQQKWQTAEQLDAHSDGDTSIRSVEYSRDHGRLYVGYGTGALTYIDPVTLKSVLFHKSPLPISRITEAGNFLLFGEGAPNYVLMDSSANEINRFDDFELDYAQYDADVLWLQSVNTLAFLDRQPGIRTYQINQVSGAIENKNHVEYSQSHKIDAPLVVSGDDTHFVVGTGTTYTVDDLSPQLPLNKPFIDAQWSAKYGIIALHKAGDQAELVRYNADRKIAESIAVKGTPLRLIRHGEKYYAATSDEQGYHFTLFEPSNDTDKDGVPNESDAFPNDPAASVDTDNDGAPDYWNANTTQIDSNSGLILDAYPNDWTCYLESDGNGTNCNYEALLPQTKPDFLTAASNGIIYSYFMSEATLTRWDSKSQSYLIPQQVQRHVNNESFAPDVLSFSPATDRLYLGYKDGTVSFISLLDGSGEQSEFVALPGPVIALADAGQFLKIQSLNENRVWLASQYYDHDGNAIDQPTRPNNEIAHSLWNETTSRFYYIDKGAWDFQYEQLDNQGLIVNTVTGEQVFEGVFLAYPTGPLLLSPDDTTLILGNQYTFDATNLQQKGRFSSFDAALFTSDGLLMIANSVFQGGEIMFLDATYDRQEVQRLTEAPIGLFEIDQKLYVATHGYGSPTTFSQVARPGTEIEDNSEVIDSSLDNETDVDTNSENESDTTDDSNDSDTDLVDSTEPQRAPAELVLDNFPEQMTYGVEYQFSLQFVNAADDSLDSTQSSSAINTEMIAAPEGMHFDNGIVTWQPNPVMFTATEYFYATFEATDGTVETLQFRVVREEQPSLIVKSRLGDHYSRGKMKVLDWDGDGVNELLSADSQNRISTMEIVDGELSQKWLYPFSPSDNEAIQIIEQLNHDTRLLLVTRENVEVIESPDTPPVVVYTPEGQIYTALYRDLNNDGVSELVLELNGGRIEILNTQNFTVNKTLNHNNSNGGLAAGNFDDDPALEIVTGGGDVFDGVTGDLQSTHPGSVGGAIVVGDINNDGHDEVISSGYWTSLRSFDPRTGTVTNLGLQNICSIEILNTDSDPQNEIIVTGCQSDGVSIYDVSTGTAELQYNFDYAYDNDAQAMITGDIDNDGFAEIIWQGNPHDPQASGNPNYSPLVIAAIPGTRDTTPVTPIIRASTPADRRYIIAERLNGTGEPKRADFILPGATNRDGLKLASLNADGELTVSDELTEESVDTGYQSFVMGTGNDLTIAMPVGQSSRYVEDLQIRQLSDYSLLAEHSELGVEDGFFERRLSSLRGAILDDGTTVALIGTSKGKIQVYDIAQNKVLWDGPIIDDRIENIGLVNDGGTNRVFVQTSEQLTWYQPVAGNLHIAASKDERCLRTQMLSIESEVYIACMISSQPNQFAAERVIKVFDKNFLPVSQFSVPFYVTQMTTKHSPTRDKLLLGGYVLSNNIYIVDPLVGTVLWKSPSLLGEINGIHYQSADDTGASYISISTDTAIYLTK